MFGYRESDKPYLRAFLPELQAVRFSKIQQAESSLRGSLVETPTETVTIEVDPGMKPTRMSVLDPDAIEVFKPGGHVFPFVPRKVYNHCKKIDVQASSNLHQQFYDRVVSELLGGSTSLFQSYPRTSDALTSITIDQMLAALDWFLVPEVEAERGNWKVEHLRILLNAAKAKLGNEALLYVRLAKRTVITHGMLSGLELHELRNKNMPVLCFFWDESHAENIGQRKKTSLKNVDFSYGFPEIVFPVTMPGRVFNSDTL